MAIVMVVVGIVLIFGFRRQFGPGMTNELAGFLLGWLLFLVGLASVVLASRQTIVIDPARREISVSDANMFRAHQRTVRFDEITRIGIGSVGRRSSHVMFYYLVLHLRAGEEYPLFAPGYFYAGGTDRGVVESWRSRLEGYLQATLTPNA